MRQMVVFVRGVLLAETKRRIVVVSDVPGVGIKCGNVLVTNTRIPIPILIREEVVAEEV